MVVTTAFPTVSLPAAALHLPSRVSDGLSHVTAPPRVHGCTRILRRACCLCVHGLDGMDVVLFSSFAWTSDAAPVMFEPHSEDSDVQMEGYLFKRGKNTFKTWNRRWFQIQQHRLVYRKRGCENVTTVLEEDLRICTAKLATDVDRRFCFEVVSPNARHLLQADSELECQRWIQAFQAAVSRALRAGMSREDGSPASVHVSTQQATSGKSEDRQQSRATQLLEQLGSIPGNQKCCDCSSLEPRWASINLGITLCIECSGIHRSLGVHVSKVRSVTLDAWEPELLLLMAELGNDAVNAVYEECANETGSPRAVTDSPRDLREHWIRTKYVNRALVKKMESDPHQNGANGADSVSNGSENSSTASEASGEPVQRVSYANLLLFEAANKGDLPLMCRALAQGADVNWRNPLESEQTPLMRAVHSGSITAVEYLLLNGAKINVAGGDGRTGLHHATMLGHTGQVCLLLKRGADQSLEDHRGLTALTIAMENVDADIVTLLRLAKLNEEMKESDMATSGDATFAEVFKDFSNLASTNPTVLKRN